MRLSKFTKVTSALFISTVMVGMVALPQASYGLDKLKRDKEAQVAREAGLRAAGGAAVGQINALNTFKDALEDPSDTLADGSPLDVALRAASAQAGSAANGLIPAAPNATEGHKINALRVLEASAVAGDAAHKTAIRTALGLHATGANPAAVTASIASFVSLATKCNYFDLSRQDGGAMGGAMGAAVIDAAAGAVAGDAAHGLPTATPANKVAVIRALVATIGGAPTVHDAGALNKLKVALGINTLNLATSDRLLRAYSVALG